MVSQPKKNCTNVFSLSLVAKIEKPRPGFYRNGVDLLV